jgi:molybdopterin/thiamine biosynthesis adenylyltransferase
MPALAAPLDSRNEHMVSKPKISDNVEAGVDRGGNLHFVLVNARRHMTVRADPLTIELLSRMDGTRTIEELAAATGGTASAAHVAELVEKMAAHRLIVDGAGTSMEEVRHQRQLAFFSDFTDDPQGAQRRLAASTVTLLGLGTVGGAVAAQLVQAGVGTIRAFDPDVVSETNLARHAFFQQEDVGQPKTVAARARLLSINNSLNFDGRAVAVASERDVELLARGSDLVMNCADQPSVAQTSEWVGRACMRLHLPHILCGGYRTHLGFLGPTIIPGQSACWKCFASDYEENDTFARAGWRPLPVSRPTGGSLGPLGAIVAGFHAWEAIRLLSGVLPPRMLNCKGEVDFMDFSFSFRTVKKREDCPVCGSFVHLAP